MFTQKPNSLVVIFGGAGYIGCPLTKLLLEEGYQVRIFDNFTYGREGIETIKHPNLELMEGDVGNIYQVAKSLKNAVTVVYLADMSGKRFKHVDNEASFRDCNYTASLMVLVAAKEYGVERFIYASTDSVYGNLNGLVYETAVPEPVSLYSRLKLRMEEHVIRYKSRNFYPTVLRIANCYGYSPRMRFDLLPNAVIRDAIFKKQVTIESENSCRAFIHVDDVAKAITTCVKSHINLVSGETFNVGANNQNLTSLTIVNVVKKFCNNFKVKIIKDQPDLSDYKLSCKKIEKLLNFTPTWTIEDGLIDLRQKLLANPIADPYDKKYHNFKVVEVLNI
jgi:nucleoside-diphosphate-sugar epimerase